MPHKRQASPPPKDPSPPPSSSSTSSSSSSEEEEVEEINHTNISTPISSQPTKKPTSDPTQNQKPNSSSEEESDEEDEEEESEDEKSKFQVTTQSKPTQLKKQEEEDGSDDESGSGSGSDSDLPPPKKPTRRGAADPTIKPISTKPMDAAQKIKKPAVKPAAASPTVKSTPLKRPAGSEANDKDSKKRQRPGTGSADAGEEDEEAGAKKQLFQRIWSEDDEISILKGMIEFIKRGSDVSSDLTGFHEYVKKFFHADMSRNQVSEKIRRMKKKYQNNAEKARKGKEPTFSKDHDRLVYSLSKKIWGNDMEIDDAVGIDTRNNADKRVGGNAKNNKKSKEESVEPKSPSPMKSSARKSLELGENRENHAPVNDGVRDMEVVYPNLKESLHSSGIVSISGLGESDVKRALELMGHSQAKEWDERWMKLRSKERDIYMERATLVYDLVKQCYDLVKSSED